MSNIHDILKDDDVNGVIIGGDFVCGYLYYGERKALYKQLWAQSESELRKKAEAERMRLLEENKEIAWHLWPDNSLWSLKLL